jgi:hypothetical protein
MHTGRSAVLGILDSSTVGADTANEIDLTGGSMLRVMETRPTSF